MVNVVSSTLYLHNNQVTMQRNVRPQNYVINVLPILYHVIMRGTKVTYALKEDIVSSPNKGKVKVKFTLEQTTKA